MSEFSGADKVVCYLTGASVEGLPQESVLQSLGRYRSSVRATFLSFIARRSIFGIRIDFISPSCLTGNATIQSAGTQAVTFSAPNGKAGPAVSIANGETKLVHDQEDVEKYVLVTRTTDQDLIGHLDLEIREEFNNVVSGNNIRQGDITNAVIFVNQDTNPVGNFTLWTPPLVTDLQNAMKLIPGAGWEPSLYVAGTTMPVGDATDWHPDTRMIQIRTADGLTVKGHVAGVLDSNGPNALFWITEVDPYGIGGLTTGQAGEMLVPVSPLRIASEVPQIDADGTFLQDVLSINNPPPTSGGISAWNYGIEQMEGFLPMGTTGNPGILLPNEAIGIWLHKRLPTDDPILDSAHVRQAWSPNLIDDLAWSFTDSDAVDYSHHARGHRRRWGRYNETRYLTEVSRNEMAYTPLDVDQYLIHPHAPTELPVLLPFQVRPPFGGNYRYRTFRVNEYGMQTLIGEYSLSIDDEGALVVGDPSEPVNLRWVQDGNELVITATYYAGVDGPRRRADIWKVIAVVAGRAAFWDGPMNGSDIETLSVRLWDSGWQAGQTGDLYVYVERSRDIATSTTARKLIFLAGDYTLAATEADQFLDDRRVVP